MNYFKEEELAKFVKDFLLTSQQDQFVVRIANNGSNNSSILNELTSDSRVRVDGDGTNLGYFGGAAFALEAQRKEFGDYPGLTVVSNFDLEWEVSDLVKQLYEESKQTECAVIAPRIVDMKSKVEMNPYYVNRIEVAKLNRLIQVSSFYMIYLIYQWLHLIKRFFSKNTSNVISNEPVYAVHGSFVVIKKEYFENGASLTYGSFLYGEEIFMAEETRRIGLKTCVFTSILVTHNEHITTGKIKGKKHMHYLNKSLRFLKKTYFSK
jgi:GT2 family glycosyltransferase